MRDDQPLKILTPDNLRKSFIEDLEALSSPSYRLRIQKARKEKKVTSREIYK